MKISIDIETSGIHVETCKLLEIGAVNELGEKYHQILPWTEITGSPFALHLNTRLLKILAGIDPYPKEAIVDMSLEPFVKWLKKKNNSKEDYTVIGKNFGSFDYQFLKSHTKHRLPFSHRFIDVGNLFMTNRDSRPPNFALCCERAGIQLNENQFHSALYDAELTMDLYKVWSSTF